MSTQLPITHRYYPQLSSIVSEQDIPDILGFIKTGVINLLSKIHYKDLHYSKSAKGDAAFYSLSIVSKRLEIEIPGTEIFLILNPDLTLGGDSHISAFPITVEYEWKILAYLRQFSLGNFSFDPQQIFEVALRVLNVTEEQAIANFVNIFVQPINDRTPLHQLVEDLNAANTSWDSPIPPPTSSTTITEIVQDIFSRSGKFASLIAFSSYIQTTNDIQDTANKVKTYFRSFIPQDIDDFIKDVILPKFRATLLLSAGIEFPRKMLKPVYDENGINPYDTTITGSPLEVIPADAEDNPKVMLTFGEALFYADTERGFGYNMDLVLNTNVPAQIGNTGLIIDIQNLKIDLSTKENIAESDADGRPKEFMGVYMEYTEIFLPKKWFKKQHGQTLGISANHLLIGTGGISGTLALRATYTVDENNQVTNYFTEYFDLQYPVTVTSKGTDEIIANHNSLCSHINSLPNKYLLKFKFPLTIKHKDGSLQTFEDENNYFTFINTINPNQFLWFNLGKDESKSWRLGFDKFDISFEKGTVVSSDLHVQLEIPKFKREDGVANSNGKTIIDLNGHWNNDDSFNLTASFFPKGLGLNLFDFVTLNFLTVELGRENDNFYIGTQCEVWFQNEIMQKILGDQKIVIPKLRVYDDGSMEIVGGNSFIPTNVNLNLGPIEVSVTGIHMGSYQQEHNGKMRKYNYWGFDGAISLDPLGIDARGEGIKYYYTTDNDEKDKDGNLLYPEGGHSFLRIQTIEVDLIIPGSASPETAIAIIHGMVSIPEPGVSPEYIGEVSLKLPKAKIAGGAAMRLQPKYPAFILDAFIDLPAPIPIGPLGIYGFRGLLGFRYVAEKEAVGLVSGKDTWYDYYTHPPKGIHISKFSGPERTANYNFPFSVGAGAVLGTSFDSGTVLSLRAMLLLSLPTLFLVEGKASIISARLGLDDNREPPFFAFVAWGDNSIEMGMGADFQLPQSNGWIIDLYAEVQAGFFFKSPKNWYINFGTRDKPVSAKILTIITAQSYLMLSARGIEAGARVEFNLKKRFGPASVHINAYLELGGFISFERPQIGGYIALGGMIDIDIWIVGITLKLDAILSVEAARPFLIYAEIKLRVCVRIVFKVCKSFTVQLKWEKNNEIDRSPIPALPYKDEEYQTNRTKELVQGVHMLTNESFDIDYLGINIASNPLTLANSISKIIPLDTYIDIKTAKGLIPNAVDNKIGGHTGGADNFIDLIPPQRVVRGGREIRQVKHKYSIEEIKIKAWTGSSWKDYHPFEAVVKEQDRNQVKNLPIGYWQRTGNQYDSIRLLATNPFTYTESGEPGWLIPEQYGITPSELFCESTKKEFNCANVLNKALGTIYYPPTQYIGHDINGAYFTLDGNYETTVEVNPDGTQTVSTNQNNFRVTNVPNNFNFEKSLEFDNGNSLVIILPNPSVEVKLKLTSDLAGVLIKYYSSNGIKNYNAEYNLIHQEYKKSSELLVDLSYKNEENLISKIVIEPKKCSDIINTQIHCQVYNEIDNDGLDEYRFRIYNHKCEVVLSSSTRYYTKQAAINELNTVVFNIINNESSIQIKKTKNLKWYFNIIDNTGEIIARRIEYFSTLDKCKQEVELLKSLLKENILITADEPCKNTKEVTIHTPCEEDDDCSFCSIQKSLENHFITCFSLDENPTIDELNNALYCLEEFADIIACRDRNKCGEVYYYDFPIIGSL